MGSGRGSLTADTVFRSIPGGLIGIYWENGGPILFLNQEMLSCLGYQDKEELFQETQGKIISCIHPDDRVKAGLVKMTRQSQQQMPEMTCRMKRKDGTYIWIYARGRLFPVENGRRAAIFLCLDFTSQHEMQEQIARNEERYRIALAYANIEVWEYDIQRKRLFQPDHTKKFRELGMVLEPMPECLIEGGYIHPVSFGDARRMFSEVESGAEHAEADLYVRYSVSEEYHWEKISFTSILGRNGKPDRSFAVSEDISRQKTAEIRYQQEMQARQASLDKAIANAKINLTTDQVEFLQIQDQDVDYLTMSYGDLLVMGLETIANGEDQKRCRQYFSRESLLKAYEEGKKKLSLEYRRKDGEGHLNWAEGCIHFVQDAITRELYAFATIRDITEQKNIESLLRQRAEKDMVTGVYNKDTSLAMMQEAAQKAARLGKQFAILIFNLDNCSVLLKNSGMDTADDVLKELCELIQTKFGPEQIVGRFYSDEFTVFLGSDPIAESVLATAEEIRQIMCMPYLYSEPDNMISASVGIAFSDKIRMTFEEVYARSRIALGAAKREGRNRCVVYDDKMDIPTAPESVNEGTAASKAKTAGSESILLRCAFSLISAESLEQAVQSVLRRLGEYYKADSAYLMEIGQDRRRLSCLYRWLEEGKPDNLVMERRMGEIEAKHLIEKLSEGKVLHYTDMEGLAGRYPESGSRIRRLRLKTLSLVPLMSDRQVMGFIGLHNVSEHFPDLALLESVGKFTAGEMIKRRLQNRQEYLSHYDAMTGLRNRSSYMEYRIGLSEVNFISMGVASFDINGLKQINARYGQPYGDEMVRLAGEILKKCFNEAGQIFRFAGDEFLVICENITQEVFINHVLEAKKQSFEKLPQGMSAGYSWETDEISVERLIRYADDRMILDKKSYYKSQRALSQWSDPAARLNLIKHLEDGWYKMVLQPKADSQTGAVRGAEALARMRHPKYGLISPDQFIPAVERDGNISYIDLFIFEEVCKTLSRWQQEGKALIPVSLNFSRNTLLQDGLIERMEEIRNRYGTPSSWIEIEITESEGGVDRDNIVTVGQSIVESGYRLALDDFGARYSNLSILASLKFDVVKLDKSLIHDLFSNRSTRVIVNHFLQICRTLGIETVAEGVETNEQLEILAGQKCDMIQGFLIDKPLLTEEFEKAYLS
ncbi:EAL domain-containing protein [Anaerolentibacter hominis]|uniref:EAL domain-containing protein n=1 Tax=Anaerolentibacter hominis TaxID=3079009 RepID=UPI0031B7F0F0